MVGPDEYFRLAMVGLLTSRLGVGIAIESATGDIGPTANAIALIVLDVEDASDLQPILAALKRDFPDARLALISRHGRRDDVLAGLRAGAHGCIPRTIAAGEVAQALGLIMNGLIWIPQSFPDEGALGYPATSSGLPEVAGAMPDLTPRQRDVLRHVVRGKSNKEIARLMGLREGTVKVHVAGLLRNLGVSNRAGAAVAGSRIFP